MSGNQFADAQKGSGSKRPSDLMIALIVCVVVLAITVVALLVVWPRGGTPAAQPSSTAETKAQGSAEGQQPAKEQEAESAPAPSEEEEAPDPTRQVIGYSTKPRELTTIEDFHLDKWLPAKDRMVSPTRMIVEGSDGISLWDLEQARELWTYAGDGLGFDPGQFTASTSLGNDRVAVTVTDADWLQRFLVILDASNGSVISSEQIRGSSSVQYDDGGNLYIISDGDGTEAVGNAIQISLLNRDPKADVKWRTEFSAQRCWYQQAYLEYFTVRGNSLLLQGCSVVLDLSTGNQVNWAKEGHEYEPLDGTDLVIDRSQDRTSVLGSDGERKWSVGAGQEQPKVVSRGGQVFTVDGKTVERHDPDTGETLWTAELTRDQATSFDQGQWVRIGNSIYIGTPVDSDVDFVTMDVRTGEVGDRWTLEVDDVADSVQITSIYESDGRIVLNLKDERNSHLAHLASLNPGDRHPQWTTTLEGIVEQSGSALLLWLPPAEGADPDGPRSVSILGNQ